MAKFKKGDIVEITNFNDNYRNTLQSGIILISEVLIEVNETKTYTTYYTDQLSGNLTFTAYNKDYFDDLTCTKLLGNIYSDKALRLLYSPSSKRPNSPYKPSL